MQIATAQCELCIGIIFVVVANNLPFITVDGNGSLTHQWIVLNESSVMFTTSDADSDTVTMYAWQPLPPGSSLSSVDSNSWKFVWTPMNMNPVELV